MVGLLLVSAALLEVEGFHGNCCLHLCVCDLDDCQAVLFRFLLKRRKQHRRGPSLSVGRLGHGALRALKLVFTLELERTSLPLLESPEGASLEVEEEEITTQVTPAGSEARVSLKSPTLVLVLVLVVSEGLSFLFVDLVLFLEEVKPLSKDAKQKMLPPSC